MFSEDGLPTVNKMLQWAALFLKKEDRLAAELILALVLGSTRERLWAYPENILNQDQTNKYQAMIKSFAQGEPLQYLLGKQNFMGLDFIVNENVLIPRSDTEVLVEEALKNITNRKDPLDVLDLCTGSGAIAISLAKLLPKAKIVAVDISPAALEVAKANSILHEVEQKIRFLEGDLLGPISERKQFDLIVSNPPYITSAEMEELAPQVRREPYLALWGGDDGLKFYRKIIKKAVDYLKPGGFLFVEIGYLQGEKVKQMFLTRGFREIEIIRDWSHHERVVKGRYPK